MSASDPGSTLERSARQLAWAPNLALAIFVAASAVLALQHCRYRDELERLERRERACERCLGPAGEIPR